MVLDALSTPFVAVAPFLTLWLGSVSPAHRSCSSWSFFPVLINTCAGLANSDQRPDRSRAVIGARPLRMYARSVCQGALHLSVAGLRGRRRGLVGVVVARSCSAPDAASAVSDPRSRAAVRRGRPLRRDLLLPLAGSSWSN